MNSTADVLRVWSTTTIITTLKVVMDPVLPTRSPGWVSGFENAVEKSNRSKASFKYTRIFYNFDIIFGIHYQIFADSNFQVYYPKILFWELDLLL